MLELVDGGQSRVTFFDRGALLESLLRRLDEVFHCLLLANHASQIAGVYAENFPRMTSLPSRLDGRHWILRLTSQLLFQDSFYGAALERDRSFRAFALIEGSFWRNGSWAVRQSLHNFG